MICDSFNLKFYHKPLILSGPIYGEQVIGLIAEAFSLLSSMNKHFDAEIICTLTQYVSEIVGHKGLCLGQILDLEEQKLINLKKLEERTYLKTGIAIEASLVIPALLTRQNTDKIKIIKQFAHNLGLVFQIKDDLLCILGESKDTGKDKNLDLKNDTQTYVSLLGIEGAQNLLQKLQTQLLDDLEKLEFKSPYFKEIINWAATRNS